MGQSPTSDRGLMGVHKLQNRDRVRWDPAIYCGKIKDIEIKIRERFGFNDGSSPLVAFGDHHYINFSKRLGKTKKKKKIGLAMNWWEQVNWWKRNSSSSVVNDVVFLSFQLILLLVALVIVIKKMWWNKLLIKGFVVINSLNYQ